MRTVTVIKLISSASKKKKRKKVRSYRDKMMSSNRSGHLPGTYNREGRS